MNEFIDKAVLQAKRFEGFSETAYLCPAKKWTIGHGLNLERGIFPPRVIETLGYRMLHLLHTGGSLGAPYGGLTLNPMEAEIILRADMEAHWDGLKEKLPVVKTWCEPVRLVLLDMAFNMGVASLLGFKKTIAALREGDWVTASCEMIDSLWYREVKSRAAEHVDTVSRLDLSNLNEYQRLIRLERIVARLDNIDDTPPF